MRKILCALLVALLIPALPAWAEETASPTEATGTPEPIEIIAVEVNPIGDAIDAAPAPDAEASAEPEVTATPQPAGVKLAFEDDFALELPEGWLCYNLSGEMAEKGVLYCLSDASGERWLYIHRWTTDCADMNDLSALIERATHPQTSGVYNFNGTDFLVYDIMEGDVSCCAALMDGYILNFVFTPQSDANFMAAAAGIMSSFTLLES